MAESSHLLTKATGQEWRRLGEGSVEYVPLQREYEPGPTKRTNRARMRETFDRARGTNVTRAGLVVRRVGRGGGVVARSASRREGRERRLGATRMASGRGDVLTG